MNAVEWQWGLCQNHSLVMGREGPWLPRMPVIRSRAHGLGYGSSWQARVFARGHWRLRRRYRKRSIITYGGMCRSLKLQRLLRRLSSTAGTAQIPCSDVWLTSSETGHALGTSNFFHLQASLIFFWRSFSFDIFGPLVFNWSPMPLMMVVPLEWRGSPNHSCMAGAGRRLRAWTDGTKVPTTLTVFSHEVPLHIQLSFTFSSLCRSLPSLPPRLPPTSKDFSGRSGLKQFGKLWSEVATAVSKELMMPSQLGGWQKKTLKLSLSQEGSTGSAGLPSASRRALGSSWLLFVRFRV